MILYKNKFVCILFESKYNKYNKFVMRVRLHLLPRFRLSIPISEFDAADSNNGKKYIVITDCLALLKIMIISNYLL